MAVFDRHVMNSRCAVEHADVKAAAGKIAEALGDLYQLIGLKRMTP